MKKRIISMMMVVVIITTMICSLSISSSATSVTSSSVFDCDSTVTFKVKTNSSNSASITFQSKATTESCTVKTLFGKKTYTHTCSHAPIMVIKISPAVNNKEYYFVQDTISFNGFKTISSTLKFDKKNTTYTVKLYILESSKNYCNMSTRDAGLFHDGEMVGNYRAYVNGTWKMTSIKNCTVTNIKVK